MTKDPLLQQKSLLKSREEKKKYTPFLDYNYATESSVLLDKGEKLLSTGKVGCVLLAGGQGTRLGYSGPKGTISVMGERSLFQIHAEKIVTLSQKVNYPLPLAIMTSPQNHQETINFFLKNNNFGLSNKQLDFFSQEELFMLNEKGNPFFSAPGVKAKGPDGNGHVLKQFVQQGIAKEWNKRGVQFVNIIQVDNPLADPFPLELLALQIENQSEIGSIAIERSDPKEPVGIWVNEKGRPKVIEYTEISEKERFSIDPLTQKLKHPLANISLFCFSISFILKHAEKPLPLHKAHKKSPYLSQNGKIIHPQTPNAWKFEYFIFDWISYAKNVIVLVYPREKCFSPLKNEKGKDSLQTVQEALQKRDSIK